MLSGYHYLLRRILKRVGNIYVFRGALLLKLAPTHQSTVWGLRILLFIILCLYSPSHSASDNKSIILNFSGETTKNGAPYPWILRENTGEAYTEILHDKGSSILYLKSDRSSFSLEYPITLSLSEYPSLTWSWRVHKIPLHGDLRRKNTNDQALQILIAFENRKIISYVWDSNAPEGTITDESVGWPLSLTIKVIVTRSGSRDQNKWILERRNIYEDYRELFQEEPPRLSGVRIQTNTQHTRDSAEGFVGDIIFSKPYMTKADDEYLSSHE